MSTSGSVSSTPSTTTVPAVGSSSRLTQRSSVDLPDPDGPMTQTTSPRVDRQVDAAQHLEVAEGLVQAADLDGRVVGHVVLTAPPASALRAPAARTASDSGT